MINLMLQNKRPTICGDGEQKRTFSDIKRYTDPVRCKTESGDIA